MTFSVAPCPLCGGYSLTHDQQVSSLLAVCDVLTFKALETLGKWLLRMDRSRYMEKDRPAPHMAHTRWEATDEIVDKALKSAWDVVPAMLGTYGCGGVTAESIVEMLDGYVHDLAITGTPHSLHELAYRFETRLNLRLPEGAAHVDD